jgi:glucose/arabinose dehydrogenase
VPPVKPFEPRAAAISLGLEVVVSGLEAPVAVIDAADGSGRLFVVEKGGVIRLIENGEVLREPFLNVIDLVSGGSEQGLLSLAFEPARPERFYINYTFKDGSTVVARYRVSDNPNIADGASGEILLTLPQPAANHNGGHLLFAPDGYLWIGTGDGGAANDRFENGQNTNSLLGAMLRIDVSGERGYTIPPDNPFVGGGGAPEIWAFGLRNPWRYSFDRLTGDLWIADVGQNEWEEVHRAASNLAGLNYGWPILEGNHCFREQNCSAEELVRPITEYNHNFGCSITGGYVYRGQDFPALQGGYFFADYCSGTLWAIAADSNSLTEPTIVLESGIQISSFGEDEGGELYLTAFDGKLYRLVSR